MLYALLIGIDTYKNPTLPHLGACANDATEMQRLLLEYSSLSPICTVLMNAEASRAAVISALQNIEKTIKQNDIFVFFFAGHGARESTKIKVWGDKIAGFVCYDSLFENTLILADKEFRYLLSPIAEKTKNCLVITDCCHSGEITRYQQPRSLAGVKNERLWSDFLFSEKYTSNNIEQLPIGKHVHIAACKPDELAYEANNSGVLTRNLLEIIRAEKGKISYNRLAERLRTALQNKQQPDITAYNEADLSLNFLSEEALDLESSDEVYAPFRVFLSAKKAGVLEKLAADFEKNKGKQTVEHSENEANANAILRANGEGFSPDLQIFMPDEPNYPLHDPLPDFAMPWRYILQIQKWQHILNLENPITTWFPDNLPVEISVFSINEEGKEGLLAPENGIFNIKNNTAISIKLSNGFDANLHFDAFKMNAQFGIERLLMPTNILYKKGDFIDVLSPKFQKMTVAPYRIEFGLNYEKQIYKLIFSTKNLDNIAKQKWQQPSIPPPTVVKVTTRGEQRGYDLNEIYGDTSEDWTTVNLIFKIEI